MFPSGLVIWKIFEATAINSLLHKIYNKNLIEGL